MRTLNEKEEQDLNEALEMSGTTTISALRDYVQESAKPPDLKFDHPNLIEGGMPAPAGKLRTPFVFIVNLFIKKSIERGGLDDMIRFISKKILAFNLAPYMNVSPRTAESRIDQLVALGWFKSQFGNISNPIETWSSAKESGAPHPGITKVW